LYIQQEDVDNPSIDRGFDAPQPLYWRMGEDRVLLLGAIDGELEDMEHY